MSSVVKSSSQDDGSIVDAVGNALQTLGTVVDPVHGGHVGQQCLGGADVAGGLVSADVLLSGL